MQSLQANPGTGHALLIQPVETCMELLYWLPKSLLPPLDPCLQFMWVDFWVSGFFDWEQLVNPDCHLVYFKAVVNFLESKILLCLDDFIVTLPYSMVTITNPFQQGLQPEATLSDAARGPYFLPELIGGGIDGLLLSVWTPMAVPSCWLGTRVSSTFLPVAAWIWLITTLVSIIPTDLYCRVYVMICGAPWGLCSQPVIGVSCSLDWTGGEID